MSHHGKEISLLSVSSAVSYHEGLQSQNASAQVVVKNLAYDKQVAIRLRNAKNEWVDLPLSYAGPASEGFELWRGEIGKPGTPLDPIVLSAKATMNGQTYWDNHGGVNYRIRATQGKRLFGVVVLNDSCGIRGDGSFFVNIDVQNLGPDKRVQVVYTTDDWATVRTADASFQTSYGAGGGGNVPSPNAYGVERWLVEGTGLQGARAAYAVSYTVNGQTHWDNNFGRNYVMTRVS